MKINKFVNVLLYLPFIFLSCGNDDDNNLPTTINKGNDPNFDIIANNDGILANFNRKVVVFGIDIYAVSGVTDQKLLHAANLMAQYLDNDEDSNIDDPKVLDAMVSNGAFLVMWNNESDLNNLNQPNSRKGQDLGGEETRPQWHANKNGEFDAALEEVWHLVTSAGYASAYPDAFGETAGTTLANAMDLARGGQFTQIPNPYPSGAWYTYNDQTCDYSCQVTEYIYWAMTSILGAQSNRLGDIEQEWKLNTPEKVASGDTNINELLTGSTYIFPKVLPDGTYKR